MTTASRLIGGRIARGLTAVGSAAALGLVAACGGGGVAPEQAAENPIAVERVPDYYPAEYTQLIEGSKAEGGTLTIYSNTDQENWAPVFRDFQKKYPWITDIQANNLDSDEVFQRVLSEQATGGSPADILVSNAAQAWAEYAGQPDRLLAYSSPELPKLTEFAQVLPNVYTMATDPMTIAYNTSLLEKAPASLAELAEMVRQDPQKFQGKITTRDVGGAFGFTVSSAFTEAAPESWRDLETLLPAARPETSSGTQTEKILAGEYLAGFFISGAPAYPVVDNSGGLFQVAFPKDSTVVLPRGIGITPKAPHANTAKLFLDFVLSQEGQRAVAEGGLTAYRPDVTAAPGLRTHQEVVDAVGAENVVVAKYELTPEDEVKAFVDRWNGLLGR
ncbi:ABC transporter substrate-binding protein [Amycolatopsis sp. 195334CR]|uniref:ABC transporter substrate-binding protein n=1 Tax=Amycolatopsis sp. 195334CR TaxID=2814588 RepID=UPI001A8F354A|nr:ABC transporter substrate-binding protein [Amycolatopsis sp. 195334CR]MBN6038247.1 ABC transporter substrate-binding protein [Amycolatopsis sp. 195334CR]